VRPLGLLLRFGPALAMMGLIFLASDTPGPDLPHFGALDFAMKKGGHVVGYALLGLAYLHALAPQGAARPRMAALAVLLAALYAASDEVHQRLTPDRGPSGRDVLIDTGGASLGVGLRLLRQAVRRASADAAPTG
jgi:VanZ family protein